MKKDNNAIEIFLESVCKFIGTEEKSIEVQDELRDHIYSYIEEYEEKGIDKDSAINMALKNMGDPKALSKKYMDKPNRFKRIFYVFMIISVLVINAVSIIFYDSINQISGLITCLIIICVNIFFGLHTVDIIKSYKKEKELMNIEPIVFVKSYKQSIYDEYAIKLAQIFFILLSIISCLFILDNLGYISSIQSASNAITSDILAGVDWLTVCLFVVIVLYTMNPKGKNTVIYPQGILTFQYFITWEEIESYRFDKECIKGKNYYSLVFSFKNPPKHSSITSVLLIGSRSESITPIKVSSTQVSLIDGLFASKKIKKIIN